MTTPPYTEGVTWTLLRDVQSMSAHQLAQVEHLYEGSYSNATQGNNRPIQERNGRPLFLVTQSESPNTWLLATLAVGLSVVIGLYCFRRILERRRARATATDDQFLKL